MTSQEVILPDFEATWRWPRRINSHTADITAECLKWVSDLKCFSPEAQKAFDRCNIPLLAGLVYPSFTRDQLRSSCDMVNFLFIFDDHSDKSEAAEVREQSRIVMDALRNPEKPRPAGEWMGGEVARDYWTRVTKISNKTFQRHFLKVWEDYMNGTAQQAEDRDKAHVRDIQGYFQLRRQTSGILPSFAMLEMDKELPDYVLDHPIIKELQLIAMDLIIISNDVLSYNKEQAFDEDQHNLLMVAMHETGKTLQQALDWTGELYAEKSRLFDQLYAVVPRFGLRIDCDLQLYLDGIAQWTVGTVQWSFETERYFGKAGNEVKQSRKMRLLPKSTQQCIGPLVVNEALL